MNNSSSYKLAISAVFLLLFGSNTGYSQTHDELVYSFINELNQKSVHQPAELNDHFKTTFLLEGEDRNRYCASNEGYSICVTHELESKLLQVFEAGISSAAQAFQNFRKLQDQFGKPDFGYRLVDYKERKDIEIQAIWLMDGDSTSMTFSVHSDEQVTVAMSWERMDAPLDIKPLRFPKTQTFQKILPLHEMDYSAIPLMNVSFQGFNFDDSLTFEMLESDPEIALQVDEKEALFKGLIFERKGDSFTYRISLSDKPKGLIRSMEIKGLTESSGEDMLKDFIRTMAQSPDTLKVIRFARTDENLHMKKDELYGYQGYYQRRVDDFVYSIELIKDFSQDDCFTFNYAIIRAESDMFFPQSNENLIYRKVDEALKPISEH